MQSFSLSHCGAFGGSRDFHFQVSCSRPTPPVSAPNHEARKYHGFNVDSRANIRVQHLKGETMDRIREALLKVDLSVSSLDTAWIAVVPSANSPQNFHAFQIA